MSKLKLSCRYTSCHTVKSVVFCVPRFPLQLELLAPEEVPSQIMRPDEYRVPANVGYLFDQGKDIKEVSAANSLLRSGGVCCQI